MRRRERRDNGLLAIALLSSLFVASDAIASPLNLGMSRFYPGLFYPSSPSEAGATLVPVAPGAGFTGADFTLVESGGTIVGTVSGPGGPIAGLLIEAFAGSITVAGRSDGEGKFSLEGVPAGSVTMRFSSDHPLSHDHTHAAVYLGGARDPGSALRVEVVDFETQDVGAVALELGAVLGGSVQTSDGDALEDALVLIEEKGGSIWTTRTDPKGDYILGGLHGGSYRIRATPRDGPYIPEYFGGARIESEAEFVTLSSSEQRLDLHIDLDRGGEIRGQIRAEGSNSPYPDFIVEAREASTGSSHDAITDRFGMYAIEALPAGSYLVYVPRLNRFFPGVVRAEEARAIEVVEGETSGRIDVVGFDLGTCQLPPGGNGRIEGHLDADESVTPEIVVRAYSASDTVEAAFEQFGPYHVDCVPPGSYRVRFLPRGGYRTQWYDRASEEQGADLVTVDGDTIRSVDYRAEKSGWIAGRVTRSGGAGIEGVRVRATSSSGAIVATAETGADGSYRIDSLADGSGLPAGLYRVNAESTLVADPDLTPIRRPSLSARADAEGIRISATLDGQLSWSYVLSRHRIGSETELDARIEESVHPVGGGALGWLDRPAAGRYRYHLAATASGTAEVLRAWSDEVEFRPPPLTRIVAYPDPWNGAGTIRMRRTGSGEMSVAILTVAGRRIATVPWPSGAEISWDGADAHGRPVPSGVYFLGLRDEVGRLLDMTTIVIQR